MSAPDTKVWVRSIRYHTYWNIPRDEGTYYQVDSEQDAAGVIALKLAVREDAPAKAQRAPVAPLAPTAPPFTPTTGPRFEPTGIGPMSTTDSPLVPKRRK